MPAAGLAVLHSAHTKLQACCCRMWQTLGRWLRQQQAWKCCKLLRPKHMYADAAGHQGSSAAYMSVGNIEQVAMPAASLEALHQVMAQLHGNMGGEDLGGHAHGAVPGRHIGRLQLETLCCVCPPATFAHVTKFPFWEKVDQGL